ncbi:type 1 glutamine amidotransferase [Lichenihabitans sp. Uapishka_5]|uniref:glutamine amidotransferase-related protein n=1 Tax=Lichenihabitans sp. Uapishka_5 TaxID=3037302 RepID=UPI0029E7DFBC|nr:type 1 glutamine amidotransferase [Lichenihabitans sp. Uapishka_5]MDX7952712.1 type 1 glutamine amidotransferase [Lichenihabitans sp. Uapishka_5]
MAPTIGILETGTPPHSLAARHGRYDAMVRALLGETMPTRSYDVQAGILPASPEDHPAYVITGSSAGVYDPLAWIAPLKRFIQQAHGRTRLVGICFGHQIMAEALGGRVEKSAKGWGLGLQSYEVVAPAPWMGEATPARIAVVASHQDQVVAPPPGATVLATSAFTPHAALLYPGGTAVSMQFHPEFTRDFAAELVELRRTALPDGAADQAIASFDGISDAARVGGWIRAFLAAAP